MPYHDQTKPEVNRNDRNDMETSNGNTEEIVNDHLQCRPSSSRYQTANNPYTSTLQRPLTASNQQFTNTNATDERRGRGNETNKKRRLNLRNNNEDNGDYAPTTRNIISTNSSLLETCCRAISEKRTNRHEVIINRNDDNDDNDDNATQSVQRSSSPALEAILKGPFQSGKTSIAMDVAYSIASSPHPTPSSSLSSYSTNIVCNTCKLRYSPIRTKDGCAANDTNQLPPKGRGTDNFDTSKNHNGIIKSRNNNDDACCTCCAVAFLIPECKKSTVRFPLRCSTLDPNVGREDGDGGDEENDDDDQFVKEGMRFKERMRLLELDDDAIHKRGKHSNTTTAAAQTRQYRKRSQSWRQSYWKEDCTTTSTILKRIKVKYIKSRTDLILFLASVHSYPPEFKPWGGIIIDDLDYFIQGDDDDNDDVNANNSIDVEGYNGNPSSRTNDITNVAIRSKKTCGGTLDCMKLIQILAQLADTRDYMTAHTSTDNRTASISNGLSILACINSDRFPLPESVEKMVHNYIRTTATIKRVDDDNIIPTEIRERHSVALLESSSNIQSMWSMSLEHHDAWKQLALIQPTEAASCVALTDEEKEGNGGVQVYYYITDTLDEDEECNDEGVVNELQWGVCV